MDEGGGVDVTDIRAAHHRQRIRSMFLWPRSALFVLDALAIVVSWFVVLRVPGLPPGQAAAGYTKASLISLGMGLVGLGLLASKRLYRDWVRSVHSVELARLVQVCVMLGFVALATGRRGATPADAVVASLLSMAFLLCGRGFYRSWIAVKRRDGQSTSRIVIVGANDEGLDLCRLVRQNPELGYRVSGVVGEMDATQLQAFDAPWLGPTTNAVQAVRGTGASKALIAAGSMSLKEVNKVIRQLLEAGIPVHVSGGLRGFDYRRLHVQPLAREPLFYLEPTNLSRWQVAAKRVLDVGVASIGLFFALPVLLVSAVGIKVHDRGPVLFRQVRVGRDGRPFQVWKLRTMVVDAEARLAELLAQNGRQDGPLFKMDNDPRVTPIGRLLRATSIDELPQLVQVLRGEMSLVGPRPALPSEFAEFSEDLRARAKVLPGLTGLWQVEARDDPSFVAYERLDLFYIENWSVTLDLAVILATVRVVLWRAVSRLGSGSGAELTSTPPPDSAIAQPAARE